MKSIDRILVALDESKSSQLAANYAIDFAKLVNSKIEIVSIIKYELGSIDAGILPSDIEKEDKLRVLKLIQKIKLEHPNSNIIDFETVGIPEKKIHKAIKEWQADLLILGHHTHSFIENLFIHSVEKRLINHIECPILIIPNKTLD